MISVLTPPFSLQRSIFAYVAAPFSDRQLMKAAEVSASGSVHPSQITSGTGFSGIRIFTSAEGMVPLFVNVLL
jgi:hypothetical protein